MNRETALKIRMNVLRISVYLCVCVHFVSVDSYIPVCVMCAQLHVCRAPGNKEHISIHSLHIQKGTKPLDSHASLQ